MAVVAIENKSIQEKVDKVYQWMMAAEYNDLFSEQAQKQLEEMAATMIPERNINKAAVIFATIMWRLIDCINAKRMNLGHSCQRCGNCCSITPRIPFLECIQIAGSMNFMMKHSGDQVIINQLKDCIKIMDTRLRTISDTRLLITGMERCVFHDKEKGCLIWGLRPYFCRAMNTVISSGCSCEQAVEGKMMLINPETAAKFFEVYNAGLKVLHEVCGYNDRWQDVYFLPFGIFFAFSNYHLVPPDEVNARMTAWEHLPENYKSVMIYDPDWYLDAIGVSSSS